MLPGAKTTLEATIRGNVTSCFTIHLTQQHNGLKWLKMAELCLAKLLSNFCASLEEPLNWEMIEKTSFFQVYGETSFELICQILDKLHPISEDNKFIDLGSGVGQVVLQVAALTHCQISLGIEKAKAPSKFAKVRTFF